MSLLLGVLLGVLQLSIAWAVTATVECLRLRRELRFRRTMLHDDPGVLPDARPVQAGGGAANYTAEWEGFLASSDGAAFKKALALKRMEVIRGD